MLNRSVVHICGHVETHLFESSMFARVSREEIERRISEMAQQPCKLCREEGVNMVRAADAASGESGTMSEITEMVRSYVEKSGWAGFRNPGDVVISIAQEASKLQESFREMPDKEAGDSAGADKKRVEIEGHLAEVIIYCLIFANELNIDIVKAMENKLRPEPATPPASTEQGDYTNLSNL